MKDACKSENLHKHITQLVISHFMIITRQGKAITAYLLSYTHASNPSNTTTTITKMAKELNKDTSDDLV